MKAAKITGSKEVQCHHKIDTYEYQKAAVFCYGQVGTVAYIGDTEYNCMEQQNIL